VPTVATYRRYLPHRKSGKPRQRQMVGGAALLAEYDDCLLASVAADPSISHQVAGAVGDHLLVVGDEVRRRYGISEEVHG
jgi:hypothetical protein